MSSEPYVLYSVCVDKPGEMPFDPTGIMHTDVVAALLELRTTRRRHPHAYLATVSYARYVAPLMAHAPNDGAMLTEGSTHVH